MFRSLLLALLAVTTLSIYGCSGGGISGVSGSYTSDAHPKETLTLTKEGKFAMTPGGGAGDYSVAGSNLIFTNPMFGGAQGSIEGNKLLFPKSTRGDDFMGQTLEGTWVKQ